MGLGGTVVALHAETGCVEVVFDAEFVGGKNLGGLCSAGRGRLVEWSSLLNLSAPDSEAPAVLASDDTTRARARDLALRGQAGVGTGAGAGVGAGAGLSYPAASGRFSPLTGAADKPNRLLTPASIMGVRSGGNGGNGGKGRRGNRAGKAHAPRAAAPAPAAPTAADVAAEAEERAAIDNRKRGNQMRGVSLEPVAQRSLLQQIEFFFSDTNLARDVFMRRMVGKHPLGNGERRAAGRGVAGVLRGGN